MSLRKLNNLQENYSYHGGIAKMFFDEYFQKLVANFSNNIKTGQEMYDDMGIQDIYFQTIPSAKRIELAEALKKF